MTSNLLPFIVIMKKISHYFSQFIYNYYSLVFKEPVVLDKIIMATLPVYMKYQFKLYPFLSLYSCVILTIRGFLWSDLNRLSDPISLKLQWIQRAGNVNNCSTWYCHIIWCTIIWVVQINDHRSSSASSKKNSNHF